MPMRICWWAQVSYIGIGLPPFRRQSSKLRELVGIGLLVYFIISLFMVKEPDAAINTSLTFVLFFEILGLSCII